MADPKRQLIGHLRDALAMDHILGDQGLPPYLAQEIRQYIGRAEGELDSGQPPEPKEKKPPAKPLAWVLLTDFRAFNLRRGDVIEQTQDPQLCQLRGDRRRLQGGLPTSYVKAHPETFQPEGAEQAEENES
jgi:hypothetical protein